MIQPNGAGRRQTRTSQLSAAKQSHNCDGLGDFLKSQAQPWAEILDVLAGLVAVALLVLVFADLAGVARVLLALLFAFFVPGRAIVSNWPRMADWSAIGMSIALSLGLLTLPATISLWARAWHPGRLFAIEAAASLVGLGVAVARRRDWKPLSRELPTAGR